MNYLSARHQFENVADPMKYIKVDPTSITTYENNFHRVRDTGRVTGGRWDQLNRLHDLREHYDIDDRIKSYFDRYRSQAPWEETAFYAAQLQKIADGDQMKRNTVDALDTYLAQMDVLAADMKANGFRGQRDLVTDGDVLTDNSSLAHPILKMLVDDVAVSIGRDGALIKNGVGTGRHRLLVAWALGLKQITVRVVARHRGWQNTRDAYARGEVDAPHLDGHPHPDIYDIRASQNRHRTNK